MARYDVLIIGGGVIGLSLARELHGRGLRRIAVAERGRLGREASFAAAGMLAPNAENEVIDDFYRFCDGSRSIYPEFADGLMAETGIDIELDRSGTLYAAFTEEDSVHLHQRHARQLEAGIPVKRLSAADTREAEPALADSVRESLFFPNDWQVENRRLLAALENYARAAGIEIFENTTVGSVVVRDSRACGSADLEAEVTVLATGSWTSLIKIGGTTVPVAVRPIRGQMICFEQQVRRFRRVVYSPRGYLVPRADGRILVGATVEDVGFDAACTESAIEGLRANAAEIAPELRDLPIAGKWAGLRPFASDGLPVIGELETISGLFIATAHYRNGILLAPATSRILSDTIIDGKRSEFLDLFGTGRMVPVP